MVAARPRLRSLPDVSVWRVLAPPAVCRRRRSGRQTVTMRDEAGRFTRKDQRQKFPPHGTRARYVHPTAACRCDACTDANAAYIRAWRKSQGDAVDVPLFDVAPYEVEP